MNKKYFLLIMVLFVACFWFGFNSNFSKIENEFLNKNSNNINIQEEKSIISLISSHKIEDSKSYKKDFLWEHRKNILFEPNEYLLDKKNELIITKTEKDKNSILKLYKYNNEKFIFLKEIKVNFEESAYFLENGMIVITDEYEFYGTQVSIYSADFKKINSIKPFGKKGFNNIEISSNDKSIIILSEAESQLKLTILNSKNALIIKEKNLNEEITPNKIVSFEKGFIVYGKSKISYLDNSGDLIWSNSILLPRKDIYIFNKDLYLFNKEKLLAFNIISGELKWSKSINSFYKIKKLKGETFINSEIRPITLQSIFKDNTYLALIMGQTKKGSLILNNLKFQNALILFNINGDIVYNKTLADSVFRLEIEKNKNSNTFSIIINDDINVYKKNK